MAFAALSSLDIGQDKPRESGEMQERIVGE
jgi:hypothetical protein